jgi:hypothetical protein
MTAAKFGRLALSNIKVGNTAYGVDSPTACTLTEAWEQRGVVICA